MYKWIRRAFGASDNFVLYLCLLYYAAMSLVAPGFFSVNNSWNLLFNLLPLLLVAVGQTFVILTAGIDLSVTSVIALCSVAGGYVMTGGAAAALGDGGVIALGCLVMVAVGMGVGLLNGLAVTRLGMPAFMVTLTTMMFFSGLAIWATESQNIYNLPETFINLFYARVLGLPVPLIVALAVTGAAHLLLDRTLRGEWIYAVGLNAKVANISGVKVGPTVVYAYAVSGACAAIASILYTSRLETGSPVMGQNILLDVIGAVVIGGTSLFGGKGKIKWTVFGVMFITLLDNSLNLLGLSYFLIMIVKGTLILLAAIVNALKTNAHLAARHAV